MPLVSVDLSTPVDAPLFLRRTIIGDQMLVDDYCVFWNDLAVARITRHTKSFGREVWDWSITGPCLSPEMGPHCGGTSDLDSAKAAVRHTFDRWLAWARVTPHAAAWYVG